MPYANPVIIKTAPASPTAGVSLGGSGRGTGSPVVVWLVVGAESVNDGFEPGTREMLAGGADVVGTAEGAEDRSDVGAADSGDGDAVVDAIVLASPVAEPATDVGVGVALFPASCLSKTTCLPLAATTHIENKMYRLGLILIPCTAETREQGPRNSA